MLKPKDLSRILNPRRCVVIIYKIRCKLKIVKVKMWHFVYVNIFVKYACMVLRKTGCDKLILD